MILTRKYGSVPCKVKRSVVVIALSLLLGLYSLVFILNIYRYNYLDKNRKKLIFLLISITSISFCYIMNEMNSLAYFERVEICLREFLFLICFYFFLQNLLYISQKKYIFKFLIFLVCLIQFFAITQLILRVIDDTNCNMLFIKIKLSIVLIIVLTFIYFANKWINSLINKFFYHLEPAKAKNQEVNFIDKKYLFKQLLKFKILIYLYFFA